MNKRVYIANKLSGVPDENRPWFRAAAAKWRAAGWDVINPIEINPPVDATVAAPHGSPLYKACMKVDLFAIHNMCDAIALGPDFLRSPGARFELLTGLFFGLEFYDAETMQRLSIGARYAIEIDTTEPGLHFVENDDSVKHFAEFPKVLSPIAGFPDGFENSWSDNIAKAGANVMPAEEFENLRYSKAELAQLEQAGINPIARPPSIGFPISQGNHLATGSSARRTVSVKKLRPGDKIDFAPKQPVTEDDFRAAGLLPGGGLPAIDPNVV